MAQHRVDGIRSVDFGVTDLKAAERFYTEVWNLKPVASSKGSVYLRGTGYEHHILGLHQRNEGQLLRVNLSAPDKEAVNAIHDRVRKTNIRKVENPANIDEPGGGYGFAFQDPEGRTVRVIADMAAMSPQKDDVDRPRKLSHCVLNSGDQENAVNFWCEALGTRVIDRTKEGDRTAQALCMERLIPRLKDVPELAVEQPQEDPPLNTNENTQKLDLSTLSAEELAQILRAAHVAAQQELASEELTALLRGRRLI